MASPTVLLAVMDRSLQQQVKSLLLPHGFEVIEASGNELILNSRHTCSPHLLVLESCHKDGENALHLVQRLTELDSPLPIILITTDGSEALAVAALRAGVKDYFSHPFSPTKFIAAVDRLCSNHPPPPLGRKTDPVASYSQDHEHLIGESFVVRKLKSFLLKIASVDSHVLITGETGTGKELAARYIHARSSRHAKPLIVINCAALPDGLIESELFGYEKGAFTGAQSTYPGKLKLADGGTVVFDEIGDMSPYAQAKILRVIESKEVYALGAKRSISLDIRIIAATNRDLTHLMSKKRFRQDLYFRLNVARVHLPPLRDRKSDIVHLAKYFIEELDHRFGLEIKGLTDEALQLLLGHDWPGNIRELKSMLEAIFIDPPPDWIGIADLPEWIHQPHQGEEHLPLSERELVLVALTATHWNKSKAAERLNWSRMTLYRKMLKYQIFDPKAEESHRYPQENSVT